MPPASRSRISTKPTPTSPSAFRVGDKAPPAVRTSRRSTPCASSAISAPTAARAKIEVFADGLNIPSGVQPLPRNARRERRHRHRLFHPEYLASWKTPTATARPTNAKSSTARFGFLDTHGGSSSFLYWIDGWIYGTHGFRNHSEVRDRNGRVTVLDSGNTYRFRPDGSAFEIYTHGQTNPFGLTVDPLGNFYSADSHSKPVYMLLRGGYYEGIGKQHDGLGFAPRITDDDHGSSAIAGIAYYADDKFPEEYRGNLFNGNPVTQRINRDKLEWHGSTPKAIRQPDFLTCDDPWFRPVQVKLGPDGALYIADFYNPIIGHYEFPLADPRRDHTHGRIWRVVWRGEKRAGEMRLRVSTGVPPAGDGVPPSRTSGIDEPKPDAPAAAPTPHRKFVAARRRNQRAGRVLPNPMPDLTQLDAAGLVEKLADPNLIVRTLATNELVDRVGKKRSALTGRRSKPARSPSRQVTDPTGYRHATVDVSDDETWRVPRCRNDATRLIDVAAYSVCHRATLARSTTAARESDRLCRHRPLLAIRRESESQRTHPDRLLSSVQQTDRLPASASWSIFHRQFGRVQLARRCRMLRERRIRN